MLELRRAMEPDVSFSDDAILDGAALKGVPGRSDWGNYCQEDPADLYWGFHWRGAHWRGGPYLGFHWRGGPYRTQWRNRPHRGYHQKSGPRGESIEGPTILVATISEPAEEQVTPQVWCEEKGEVPCSDFPSWMKVLHPTWLVTAARQTPPILSELRKRHCSQIVGGGELGVKEQKNAGKLCTQSPILHHHLGLLNPYQRSCCSQASRDLWPACRGIPPCWTLLRHLWG